jgi:hypothetical protein
LKPQESRERDPTQAPFVDRQLQPAYHSNLTEKYGRGGEIVIRRKLLSQLAWLPLFAFVRAKAQEPPKTAKALKIMMKSAWGSDDPTRASFVFAHGLALAEAGHDVQIFLTGEATYLMRKVTANAVMPVGWPPLSETLEKVVAKRIPIFA